GEEVARLASAFGMRVLGMRRSATRREEREKVTVLPPGDLPFLLAESDYAVLAVPLTPETTKLIGPAQLASMKPGAILINVARGEVVDEAALVRALQEGPIGGAALDVFEREPLPPDSPLWGMPNVLVSPHVSGSSAHYDDLAADIFADNLRRYLAGEPLRNRVDPVLGY
ncbi:MAG TPA: D-2-hydroxyacid dehydrogenase, partial [Dehalococcoidia bacterium]|nr:D-2-hydroxyacid dehydrogenase [Dehalococcoidia bacterium]